MSELLEQQSEELEALESIYEGDVNFIKVNKTTYQYKYGKEDDYKSFLVELQWGENYPAEGPIINMDTFYNRNLIPAVKAKIRTVLSEEAAQWLGCGVTYTLFECIKDRVDELTKEQPASSPAITFELDENVNALKISNTIDTDIKKREAKKEQLTKAQKRRQWERTDHKGDRPRGWDWVDIVKHLSQTGGKVDDTSSGTTATTTIGISTPILQPLNI